MNQHSNKTHLVVMLSLAIGVIAGVAIGFFFALDVKTDNERKHGQQMTDQKDMARERDEMSSMPGMSAAPSGVVAIPAMTTQLIGVRTASVKYGTLEQDIRAVGTVSYDERGFTRVNLKTSGWVREVFVNSIGRPVRKDEALLTLYSPDLLATQEEYLLALKAQANVAASPLEEVKADAAALVASARERLRLWDLTERQIAALERRRKAEPVLTVYAPSAGIVLMREAVPGRYVEPGTTLYEIADLSTVWIFADIYESEVAAVTLNQPAAVTFAAYPGEMFRGTVSYIYPSLNADTRTVRVRLELPNPELKLKPGMYGNVNLETSAVETLVVPKEAVLETGLRQLVFIDQGQGRYLPAMIKLGRRSQDALEVLEGVKEGDRIVTSANFLLDAESKLASASSMQGMMGRVGMADWQMRGAYEKKMEGMPGMEMSATKSMEPMKGIDTGGTQSMAVSETGQTGGLTLTLTTMPEKPKAGEVLLRLKVIDQAGKPVANAQVLFLYTMPMPGMTESKTSASYSKDGFYEGKAAFGMGGTWVVTANVLIAGRPTAIEKFQLSVGGGM
jgi:membrane fusion protein, copper/silver efflux system